jgi:hypothetical protein
MVVVLLVHHHTYCLVDIARGPLEKCARKAQIHVVADTTILLRPGNTHFSVGRRHFEGSAIIANLCCGKLGDVETNSVCVCNCAPFVMCTCPAF